MVCALSFTLVIGFDGGVVFLPKAQVDAIVLGRPAFDHDELIEPRARLQIANARAIPSVLDTGSGQEWALRNDACRIVHLGSTVMNGLVGYSSICNGTPRSAWTITLLLIIASSLRYHPTICSSSSLVTARRNRFHVSRLELYGQRLMKPASSAISLSAL